MIFHMMLDCPNAEHLQESIHRGAVPGSNRDGSWITLKDSVHDALRSARRYYGEPTTLVHIQWTPTDTELLNLFLSGSIQRSFRSGRAGIDILAGTSTERLSWAFVPLPRM